MKSLFAACCALAVCIAWNDNNVRQRTQAVSMLEAAGATVTYDYQRNSEHGWRSNASPPGWWLLHYLLGANYQAKVVKVQLFAGPKKTPYAIDDESVRTLTCLKDVEWLILKDTGLTDVGLTNLHGFKKLTHLDLQGSPVTAAGVAALQKELPTAKVYYSER